jgi:hypothetical protein
MVCPLGGALASVTANCPIWQISAAPYRKAVKECPTDGDIVNNDQAPQDRKKPIAETKFVGPSGARWVLAQEFLVSTARFEPAVF